MLRDSQGIRKYTEVIKLTKSTIVTDDYGHPSVGATTDVLSVYGSVRQMSASKTMLTFQQADVVGLEIEFRAVGVDFNGLVWRGHSINFSSPEEIERGRFLRITGYYQEDNPSV